VVTLPTCAELSPVVCEIDSPVVCEIDRYVIVTASVVDPFGNILGIMYNPHHVEILTAH
jgi:hypothetical protein